MSNSANVSSISYTSTTTRCFKFYVDSTKPSISVNTTSSWLTTYVIDSTSSYISASITDSHSGLLSSKKCIKSASATSYTCYSNSITYATSSYLTSGINYIYYTATDYSGNSNTSTTYSLYLDEINPTFTATATSTWLSSYVINNTSSYARVTSASDTHSGIKNIIAYVKKAGATTYSTCSTSTSTSSYVYATSSCLASGVNYIYFTVSDNVGHSVASSTYTVYLDKTAPSLSTTRTSSFQLLGSESVNYYVDSSSYYIYATIGDDEHSGLSSTKMYVKKAGASSYTGYDYTSDTKLTATSSYLATGANYVYFTVSDVVGNTKTSSTFVLYLDKTHPTAVINDRSISVSEIDLTNRLLTIPFNSLSDAHSGLKSISATNLLVTGENGTCSTSTKKCTFSLDAIKNQTLQFKFTVTDGVGNTTSDSSVTISIDPTLNDLSSTLKSILSEQINTTLTGNGTTQLKYRLDSSTATIISDLPKLGLGLEMDNDADLKYIFVVSDLSSSTSDDLLKYKNIAKHTTVDALSNEISSPVGMTNSTASLVLFVGV